MADPFQPKFVDLVRNTTTTTGTGNIVLGAAVAGFTGFASAVQAGEQFYYSVIGVDKPAEREVGRGTMQANGTISRDPISGTKTNFTTGKKNIALIAAAEWYNQVQAGGGGGTAPSFGSVASRAELGAAPKQAPAILSEPGREGLFVFEAGDFQAQVAADTAQGIHVAPSSDPTGASGAWLRKFSGGVDVRWFGATGDGATNDGAAFVAALATLKQIASNSEFVYKGSPRLFVPAGHYFLGTTTLEITHTLIVEGESSGLPGGLATKLRWSDNVTGIRVQSYNTANAGDVVAAQFSGSGTVIRQLSLIGGVPGTEAGLSGGEGEFHAIHVKAATGIFDVFINGFRGDAVYAHASSGAGSPDEGNANCCFIERLYATCVRDVLNIDGGDVNVWTTIGVNGRYVRRRMINDSSFLGNTHIGAHAAEVGSIPGVPSAWVSESGRIFAIKEGREVQGATNPPPAAPASDSNWHYVGPGAVEAGRNRPAWASGLSLRAAGSYFSDSLTAMNRFDGCYSEGGSPPSQFMYPTMWGGGLHGAGVIGNATQIGPTVDAAKGTVTAARLTAKEAVAPAVYLTTVHNSAPLSALGSEARVGLANGYEADGASPAYMAAIGAWSNTADPATAQGSVGVYVRQPGGAMSLAFSFADNQGAFLPGAANSFDLGIGTHRWRWLAVQSIDASSSISTSGTIAATGAISGSNLSGTNSGDQFTSIGQATFVGRAAGAGAGAAGALTAAQAKTALAMVPADVTFAATAKLLGRATVAGGPGEEVGLASGLVIAGSNLTLGAITPTSVAAVGAVTSSGGGMGYAAGAGGVVTQATSKSTGVTLNKACGAVTTHNAALAANTTATFTVTNSAVAATDVVDVSLKSGNATAGTYQVWTEAVAAGSFKINVRNISASSLSEALVLNFAVMKAVTA